VRFRFQRHCTDTITEHKIKALSYENKKIKKMVLNENKNKQGDSKSIKERKEETAAEKREGMIQRKRPRHRREFKAPWRPRTDK
jgi:hypothetical protein